MSVSNPFFCCSSVNLDCIEFTRVVGKACGMSCHSSWRSCLTFLGAWWFALPNLPYSSHTCLMGLMSGKQAGKSLDKMVWAQFWQVQLKWLQFHAARPRRCANVSKRGLAGGANLQRDIMKVGLDGQFSHVRGGGHPEMTSDDPGDDLLLLQLLPFDESLWHRVLILGQPDHWRCWWPGTACWVSQSQNEMFSILWQPFISIISPAARQLLSLSRMLNFLSWQPWWEQAGWQKTSSL